MTTITLFFMYHAMLLGPQPQTVEEMTRAEYQATFGVDYIWPEPVKAGYSLELNSVETLRVVNSDGDVAPEATRLKVTLASWFHREPERHVQTTARIFGYATGSVPRAVVTFSPGASVGKGVYEWRAAICNPNLAQAQSIDPGWIEGAAAANGISRTDDSEAATANDLQRNKSKPIVGTQIVQGGLEIGTGVIAIKAVAASSPWGVGFVLGTVAARYVVNYWKSVTVPDFNMRFVAANFLGATGQPYLLPPGSCVPKGQIFFSRTGGTTPVANVPIY